MLKLHEIQEKRSRLIDAGKAIEQRAKTEKRDALTADETTELDRIASEIETLNADERRARIFEEAERRAAAEPVTGGRDTLADVEQRFSLGRALADFAEGGRLTGAEAEWNAERRSGRPGAINVPTSILLESRAATVGGSAGNLVAHNLGPTIDRLRPVLAIQRMGATVLSGLTSFLDLPRMTASGSASWVAEGGAATRSDASFDKVSLSPKTVTAEYEMSRRMMIQAPEIEAILRKDIGWLLAQALDSAAIQGGGTNQPTGILANSSVPVVNAASLIVDVVPDMIRAINLADCDETSLSFLTNNKVKALAMKAKDANGQFYGLAQAFQNQPVTFSNQVPSNLTKGATTGLSAMIYGAWADLILGYWSGVDILLNPYHSDVASKGGALLHAFLDCDLAFRHPECFVVCKDIAA